MSGSAETVTVATESTSPSNVEEQADSGKSSTLDHVSHDALESEYEGGQINSETPVTTVGEADASSSVAERPASDNKSKELTSLDINSTQPVENGPESAITPTPLNTRVVQEATSPVTLDALLSPKEDRFSAFSPRESIATSVATDDDGRFSTVLLSARQSMENVDLAGNLSDESNSLNESEQGDEKRNTLNGMTGSEMVTFVHQNRVHKKTASTSTIVSASNVPFLSKEVDQADEYVTRPQRTSLDGQQKIQEEFNRLQNSRAQVTQSQDSQDNTIDWAFWGDVVSDYQKFAAEHSEQLAKAIERGIPKSLRGMIWQLMSASKDPELEQTYLRLIKETSPHEKQINRDLGRTFPHHAFFTDGQGIGQENLFNVLKAYSLYDPQVGYCQGLPFVAAVLLLNMPDEEAFCLLVRLMHSYDLRGHFLPEMPKLQLRLFQFDRLIEELLPVLHVHFIRQGIKSSMFCSQWFLTMFSYRFPLDIVFRIYDNCLASGIEAMFAFSMCLLYKNEETLLTLKFDKLLDFLNTKVFDVYRLPSEDGDTSEPKYDVDRFVQDAVSLRITPFMLDNYAHEYEELVRTRDAHAIEMDALRNSNRNLSAQVNRLEASMAQLNTEHCEVLNELVKARLRNEELESELVRYKLLYAEAMHHSEDAMSSHRLSANLSRRGSSIGG
ncbi:RabGAP/TBC [Panus rudis PR-1116 ss-1]|nr:RabGAP/TBC [Panus rudis PR-1116 ss-1]